MARSSRGGHPASRFARVRAIEGDVAVIENPAWRGREVKPIESYKFCHDGTPPGTVVCSCGGENHVHLGQIEHVPDDGYIGLRCHHCREPLAMRAGFVKSMIRGAWRLDG